ncbi:hypothetical protein [Endozoicomonas ascidiicola]|uniref:YopJ family acetyltransferase n=1 Tax=Endozoicomonas ascidiicola TaxID=1698521 RepID=UPI000835E72D|nr:hypothetical protein [Endozoicomonas ascidiicola]
MDLLPSSLRQLILTNLNLTNATDVKSGNRYSVVRVTPKIRAKILGGVDWKELQNIDRREIRVVSYIPHGANGLFNIKTDNQHQLSQDQWVVEPIELSRSLLTYEMPEDCKQINYCIQPVESVEGLTFLVKLPKIASVEDGTEFVVSNQSNHFTQCIPSERRLKIDGKCDWLSPGQAVFLRKENGRWRAYQKVEEHVVNGVAANPLVRESGPVVCAKGGVLNFENDGEYFLTKPMIEQTLADRLKKLNNCFHYHYCLSLEDLGLAIRAAMPEHCYFIYENTESNHVVAGFVHHSENDMLCYLHETLGIESEYTTPFAAAVRQKIQSLFPEKNLRMIVPKERMQKDFVSCGVMAIKALLFFAKRADQLFLILNQMDKANRAIPLETISVNTLPAKLIKLCQSCSLLENHPNKETKVNSKKTLLDYVNDHKVSLAASSGEIRVNASAYLKRYKYMQQYIERQKVREPTWLADVVKQTSPVRKRGLDEASEPFTAKKGSFGFPPDHNYFAPHPSLVKPQISNSTDSSGYCSAGEPGD